MSLSQQQLEAISLLGKGVPAPRVAYDVKVSYRTLQRWLKKPDFQATLAELMNKTESKFIATQSDKIAIDLVALQKEHLSGYRLLRRIAEVALKHYEKKLLENPESPEDCSPKQITLWVQILDRGIRGEAESAFLKNLDLNTALEMTLRAGYTVYDESVNPPQEMKGFQD